MAETTGTSAPSYKLSQGTQKRVFEAGVNPTNAKSGKTARQHLTNAAIADGVDAIATGVKDQIVKKQEDRTANLAEWDAAFDEMSETGAWANENLFGEFEKMEKSQRELYVEAVRKGDKGEMAKLTKGQASRSSSLQQWKGTLEAAQKIHNGVGWSEGFMDDSEGSKENRALLTALAKMDGDMASNMEFEDGRMVFNVKGKKYTRREIDELVAEGAKPIGLELNYLNDLKTAQEAGEKGGVFNEERELKTARMSIKNEDIKHLMTQDMGGGGSFSDHIKSHTDFIKVFKTMGLEYTSTIKVGDNDVSVTDATSPGGEEITEEELANFNDDDLTTIITEMQKTPDTAREYLAEYKMLQMKTAHELGGGGKAKNILSLIPSTETERTAFFTANPDLKVEYDKVVASELEAALQRYNASNK
jgi:hypothetical protein